MRLRQPGGWQGGPNLGDFEAPSGRRGLGQHSDMIGGLVEWTSGMGLQSLHRAPWKYEPAPIKSHVTSLSLGDHVWGKRYSKPKYRGAIGSMPPAIRGMVRLLTFLNAMVVWASHWRLSSYPTQTIFRPLPHYHHAPLNARVVSGWYDVTT